MLLINKFLGYISETTIFGFMPLDVITHLLGGIFITILLLKLKFKFNHVVLIVLALSLIKEFYDSFAKSNTYTENLKDLIITMSYPTLLFLARKLKSRLQ